MSTVRVHSYSFQTEDDKKGFSADSGYKDYDGDVDARLDPSGALLIVEFTPDLEKADGSKKAALVAIFKDWEWVEVLK